MGDGPRIKRTSLIEDHERVAAALQSAAAAFTSAMSIDPDPVGQQRLAEKARRANEAAQFHRDTVERLKGH